VVAGPADIADRAAAAGGTDLSADNESIGANPLLGLSAAATFEGEFSDVTRFYAGKGVVHCQWEYQTSHHFGALLGER
jgi:hypothetical protein